ncbi:MAG TPA: hypothetical protein VGS06_11625 [Streptosporangiaceae bacterium]|nr:hypothetical protein [Streptosporangiaceae bacterium]
MNEQAGATGAGMDEAADRDDGTPMGVAEAAVIMQEAAHRARRQLRVSHRATFTIWGLGLLLGYGTMWLTVRGQRPFHGPEPAAFAVLALLSTASIMTGVDGARADSGVGGLSAVRRRTGFLSVLAGLAAMFALEGALAHAGASRAVIGVFEASAPVLVAGLFYFTTSAVWLDWPVLGLGIWLVAVAAVGGFAGPAGVWAVDALAAGLAYLLMAAIEPWLRQA